ncbi:hypothetical protein [Nocardia carnea]|uniref:Uncharacterized protein n=1 Tax=Nocardia carnea TaxID=37328 RepID=A0ABW7TLJ6_9NOCA|nr:hypothetical protein [Nocardia carnea]
MASVDYCPPRKRYSVSFNKFKGDLMVERNMSGSVESRDSPDTAAQRPILPGVPAILSVFQGRSYEDDQLLRWAHALAKLHDRRVGVDASTWLTEIDHRRRELIEEIDSWCLQTSSADTADRGETVGDVIDRLAQGWVSANQPITA